MTNRTASLLFLFVGASGVLAVIGSSAVAVATRANLPTIGLIPLIGLCCYTFTLFLGRRYILPGDLAESRPRAFVTVAVISTAAMIAVYATFWATSLLVGRVGMLWTAIPGFIVMWLALRTLHRLPRQRQLRLR